jgi:polyphosphate kinase
MNKLIKKRGFAVDRDISWMYFNRRILDEAANPTLPLLERLTFLGIYSNNLDEFFQVRVATLRRIVEIEQNVRLSNGFSKSILKQILKLNEKYSRDFETTFIQLKQELAKERIFFVNETELNAEQIERVLLFYKESLMNSLFPILVSRMTEAPELNDKSIYLAVKITDTEQKKDKRKKKEYALIEIPSAEFSRFLLLPQIGEGTCVMFLDDVIRYCLPSIFSSLNYDHYEAFSIKFTRDAEMDFDNSAYQGVLEKVSKGVKSRKSGVPIRLVTDRDMPKDLLKYIEKLLKIEKEDAHIFGARYHNSKDLMSFPKIKRSDLKFDPQPPILIPVFDEAVSLLTLIRQKDQFLHYPYHSFDYFIRILREAAISPDVKAIKISIYRLAKNSKVIKALICAAMNGKKVTAVVELLARFDESSNIGWTKKMEEAGIKVVLGVDGLKVHSKLVHISSRSGNIACVGTGNFHEGTATIYTDFTLMTARRSLVDEVESVFDFFEHPYLNPTFKELIVSPIFMRKRLQAMIRTEMENAKKGLPAYIQCKINHVVDHKIIEKLYQASNAGVKIQLMVRGNCALVTGAPKLSANIHALGIIDRYLEHSRIMIFANGGDERYYIGSADWMERNFDRRIEVYAPIHDPDIQQQLKKIIEYGLKDNMKARIVDGSGKNELNMQDQVNPPFHSQQELYQFYKNSCQSVSPITEIEAI